ncbi:MAG: hypothetical protein A3A73_03010 [Omnitrophica bacterium RIFCSPLOWO2_01_FULL_50_24]|nr:MAG: hypothetical protein A3A73_03010 [Omnitrophica bacterium RIFCSPLOWO2_01_FULL_50_24]
MNQATQGLPIDQQRMVKRTLLKLNTNPEAVLTNVMSKQAVQALGNAGMLQGKFQANHGMAISHVQKVHAAGAVTVTSAQKKEQEHAEARAGARFEDIARQKREEAEGHLTEEEIHGPGHGHDDIHSTSIGMKGWQGAKVGIGQVMEEKNNHSAPPTTKEPPVVEMNIG